MTSPFSPSLFLGRFHPVLVHLPIGLLAAVAWLELVARFSRFRGARAAVGPLLAVAVPAALASAASGWWLAGAGDYDPSLVLAHRWLGTATAALSLAAAAAHRAGLPRLYAVCLAATLAALTAAGHFGGSLTHGRDYLTRYAPPFLRPGTPSAGETASLGANTPPAPIDPFREHVAPVLERYCAGCHGAERQKGRLRLDSLAHLLAGGASGPVVVPGDPEASPLFRRLLLPLDTEDHMPPAGKPQPSAAEIERLRAWIRAGLRSSPRPPAEAGLRKASS